VRELVNLGALLLLVQLAIIIFMVVLGLPTLTNSERELTMQEYVELLQGKEWILAIGFLMMAAIRGLVWFAAPLITFHGMSTSQAMRWSLYAFISNIGAMMVYGTVLLGLFMVAIIPWALGLVLVIPLAVISTYVGYREVFETPRRLNGRDQTAVSFAYCSASHFVPSEAKRTWTRASSPRPSKLITTPSPNFAWRTFWPIENGVSSGRGISNCARFALGLR
jgi:hypothetical protein